MKKILILLLGVLAFASCQKAPEIIISGEQRVVFDRATHSFTVSVTSNRAWVASPAQSWIHVSPSSLKEVSKKPVDVTITIDENNSYDVRTADIIFSADEMTRNLTIEQGSRHAVMLPAESKLVEVAAAGKTLDLEVWANVDYDIIIPADCDWIKLADSKALPTHHHSFIVAENGTRQNRTGHIEFVNEAENFRAVAEIKQGFYEILVSRDTLRTSGRGYVATFETVGPEPEEYLLSIEDRWLALDRTEKVDGRSRFYLSAQPMEEGASSRVTRVLVFYKNLAEPDTLNVRQYAPMRYVSYTTNEKDVSAPTLDGDRTIAFVSWGDGLYDVWNVTLSHSYASDGPHTIGVEFGGKRRVHMPELQDGMTINMREARK